MRISETKVVQLVEGEKLLVVLDEATGCEIVFTPAEADALYNALAYFDPYMHGMFTETK